jgi:hypothetical protein
MKPILSTLPLLSGVKAEVNADLETIIEIIRKRQADRKKQNIERVTHKLQLANSNLKLLFEQVGGFKEHFEWSTPRKEAFCPAGKYEGASHYAYTISAFGPMETGTITLVVHDDEFKLATFVTGEEVTNSPHHKELTETALGEMDRAVILEKLDSFSAPINLLREMIVLFTTRRSLGDSYQT